MTKVDFYIIDNGGVDAALLFACKLAEKAWRRGHGIQVVTRSPAEATRLDALMWAFRRDSFLPHSCSATERSANTNVIAIADREVADSGWDVLINLGRAIDSSFSRYQRVAEIVCQEQPWLPESRDRYRYYRDRGYPLDRHKVAA